MAGFYIRLHSKRERMLHLIPEDWGSSPEYFCVIWQMYSLAHMRK